MKWILALGPAGTNGHHAASVVATKSVRHRQEALEIRFCPAHATIMQDVANRQAPYGVVPIENSTRGCIHDVIRFWLDLAGASDRPFGVIGEVHIPLQHCLLVPSSIRHIREITTVVSQSEALNQCRTKLEQLGLTDLQPALSTAAAAEQVARQDPEDRIAAIASPWAANLYGLTVIADDLQDDRNTTRFHVLGCQPTEPSGDDKTAVLLWLLNQPAALHRVLGVIASAQVNISTLHSIPVGGNGDYAFYLEFDGHIDEPVTRSIVTILETTCDRVVVLGSFPKSSVAETAQFAEFHRPPMVVGR